MSAVCQCTSQIPYRLYLRGEARREDDGILIWNYQYGWSRNVVIYDANGRTVYGASTQGRKAKLTKHFISADIDASDAECGIRISAVFIDRELPVMNSSRESDGAERHTMLPAVCRDRPVVVHEVHAGAVAATKLWIKREPRHYNVADGREKGINLQFLIKLFCRCAVLRHRSRASKAIFDRRCGEFLIHRSGWAFTLFEKSTENSISSLRKCMEIEANLILFLSSARLAHITSSNIHSVAELWLIFRQKGEEWGSGMGKREEEFS